MGAPGEGMFGLAWLPEPGRMSLVSQRRRSTIETMLVPASMSATRPHIGLVEQSRRGARLVRELLEAGPMAAVELAGWVRPRYPKLLELLRAFDGNERPPDVLVLGDSVVERVAREDADRRSLAAMVIDGLRLQCEREAVCISHMGYHTGVYLGLLRVLQITRHRPGVVILALNLRSFGPRWFLDPTWQFHEEIRALERYLAHPSRGIPRLPATVIDPADMEAFEATEVDYPETDLGRIGAFHDVIRSNPENAADVNFRWRQIFILHYMHALHRDHPRLVQLDEALGLLSRLGCSVFCYLTPLNHPAGVEYVGAPFLDAVRRNSAEVRRVAERHRRPGLRFEDFTELVERAGFFSRHEAGEHLNESGRSRLAAAVARKVAMLRRA